MWGPWLHGGVACVLFFPTTYCNTNLLTPPAAGTLVTASAHIITAVIGSGVLSLAWAIAQLGWMIGPVVLVAFSVVTWFCSSLLADCFRAPDPVHGKRNYTYGQAVGAYLGTLLTAVAHENG
jgi:amino acid permease